MSSQATKKVFAGTQPCWHPGQKLGSLNNRSLFLTVWRLEIPDQDDMRVGAGDSSISGR